MAGFSDLPAEIRLLIWSLIIPNVKEEVCLLWPGHSPGRVGEGESPFVQLPVLPLTVDTGFPLAMHICRESRAVALDPKVGGVRLRASHVARCMTPFRCFRPELDVLYLDQESIFHLHLLYDPVHSHMPPEGPSVMPKGRCFEVFGDLLRRTRRFAVPVAFALDDGYLGIVYRHLRYQSKALAPASLYIVLPYTTPYVWRGKDTDGPGMFVPPGRRCRLATVQPAALEDDAVMVVEPSYPRRAMTARQAVRTCIGSSTKSARGRSRGTSWACSAAWSFRCGCLSSTRALEACGERRVGTECTTAHTTSRRGSRCRWTGGRTRSWLGCMILMQFSVQFTLTMEPLGSRIP